MTTPAPGAAPAAADGSTMGLFKEFLKHFGWVSYLFAALSIVMVSLALLYIFTIRRGAVVSDSFMRSADALIRKNDYLGLLSVCNRHNDCIARVTQKTLEFATKNPTASFEEIREVTETEGSKQAGMLAQRVAYMADIGAIAPLVGLFGTVLGMMRSFHDIGGGASTFAGNQQVAVMQGVGQAFMSTAAGLVIAVPALIFYSIYRGKVQNLISHLEAASTQIMALLAAQYKRAAARVVRQQHGEAPL